MHNINIIYVFKYFLCKGHYLISTPDLPVVLSIVIFVVFFIVIISRALCALIPVLLGHSDWAAVRNVNVTTQPRVAM